MAGKALLYFLKHSPCIKQRWRLNIRLNHTRSSSLSAELELAFNNQINMEFYASFCYLAMASFFNRQNVSLPGCYKYFFDQVQDEREHGQKLMDFLNKRGNCVVLQAIHAPTTQSWESPLAAFKEALELERTVTQKLFDLHKLSEEMNDVCASNLLETDFLDNQVEESDRLSRLVAQLERIGCDGAGIFIFDRYLLKDSK